MDCKLFTDKEIAEFYAKIHAVDVDLSDLDESPEEDWELQNCDDWIRSYEKAQEEKVLPIIQHWFIYKDEGCDEPKVRGIHLDSKKVITTSIVKKVDNDIVTTASGNRYKLVHMIDETADDICQYWSHFKGC